jgi:hypothetical protein
VIPELDYLTNCRLGSLYLNKVEFVRYVQPLDKYGGYCKYFPEINFINLTRFDIKKTPFLRLKSVGRSTSGKIIPIQVAFFRIGSAYFRSGFGRLDPDPEGQK